MNKLMIGTAMGFMAGVGLMMTSAGKMIRKDMQMGVNKARELMKDMEPSR